MNVYNVRGGAVSHKGVAAAKWDSTVVGIECVSVWNCEGAPRGRPGGGGRGG